MWSDALLVIERLHLLRFAGWGGLSLLLGAVVLAVPAGRASGRGIVRHFALQTALWGACALAIGVAGWARATLRDYDAALALERGLQLTIRLDALIVLAGLVLATVGLTLRRDDAIGAGTGIVVQGLGWLVLHLAFASALIVGG